KVGIRPDHVELASATSPSGATGWLEVEVCEQLGTTTLLIGSMDGQRLRVLVTRTSAEPGDRVQVRLPVERLHLFDADSGARLN
ncbi:MAG: TOBE domain-containing protein, partial [Lacisediminimonas sp.]|nr:TOBE domain-containing protein [Lacisediminimonas sp.]